MPRKHEQTFLDYAKPPQQWWRRRGCLWATLALLAVPLFVVFTAAQMKFFPEPLNIDPRPQYAGRSVDAVVEDMGQPTFSRQMTVAEAAELPFRMNFLGTAYSPSNPNDSAVPVKELSWRRRRTYVTVWFHSVNGEWRAVAGVEWHRRVLNFARLEPPPVQSEAATRPQGGGG